MSISGEVRPFVCEGSHQSSGLHIVWEKKISSKLPDQSSDWGFFITRGSLGKKTVGNNTGIIPAGNQCPDDAGLPGAKWWLGVSLLSITFSSDHGQQKTNAVSILPSLFKESSYSFTYSLFCTSLKPSVLSVQYAYVVLWAVSVGLQTVTPPSAAPCRFRVRPGMQLLSDERVHGADFFSASLDVVHWTN